MVAGLRVRVVLVLREMVKLASDCSRARKRDSRPSLKKCMGMTIEGLICWMTSIMSNSGEPEYGQPTPEAMIFTQGFFSRGNGVIYASPSNLNPARFAALMQGDSAQYARVIKSANIRLD